MNSTTLLAGGVGGARLARGLAAVLGSDELTIVVNVGDDDRIHGAHVAADLDTVTYTLAGIEGPHGWGIAGDTFEVMEALGSLGVDTSFRLGDRDLATCLYRTARLDSGATLSSVTADICTSLGLRHKVIPASDQPIATKLQVDSGSWLDFQEYFVLRGHRDTVHAIEYRGADAAAPGPGVIEAITTADRVVVAPSNPPLSIHPILAIPEIAAAVTDHGRVTAVSPLFGGAALKGPAAEVLRSLGYGEGNQGVAAAYAGIITDLVIDAEDADDVAALKEDLTVHVTDTRFVDLGAATTFANWLVELP